MPNVSTAVAQRPTELDALELMLLGSPLILNSGQPLALPRRQTRALLYHIASARQPVARERLCFLLWPDTSESTARRQLTVLLNQLRAALPQPTMLMATNDWIGVDHGSFWTDAHTFLDATPTTRHASCVRSLRAVVDLYRGPFLHGFALPSSVEFEEWLAQERRVWESRFLAALQMLIDLDARGGNIAAAIDGAVRYLATDPLAEEVHVQLMELYARSGNRTAALRQFTHCVMLLERDLDVSPLPETYALYEAVRDGHIPGHAQMRAFHPHDRSTPALA